MDIKMSRPKNHESNLDHRALSPSFFRFHNSIGPDVRPPHASQFSQGHGQVHSKRT